MMNEPAGEMQKLKGFEFTLIDFCVASGDVAQRQAAAAAAALGEDAGAAPVRTIQVTPQDKQAIDRVNNFATTKFDLLFFSWKCKTSFIF